MPEMEVQSRIRPIQDPNLNDLRRLPVGSEVVVLGPEIACFDWTQEYFEEAASQLSDHEAFNQLWLYLPPVRDPQAAIDEVLLGTDLGGRIANAEGLTEALRSGWLNHEDLQKILMAMVKGGQV